MTDIDVTKNLLADAFSRVAESVPQVVAGLTPEQLVWRPGPDANPIGWLVWHLTRVIDAQIAPLGRREQLWTTEGWADRFALSYEAAATGYSQTSDEVGAFRIADPSLLTGYSEAVHRLTGEVLRTFTEQDYPYVIDTRWDPPVTVAVRLVSIVDDAARHIGQADYVRGLLGEA